MAGAFIYSMIGRQYKTMWPLTARQHKTFGLLAINISPSKKESMPSNIWRQSPMMPWVSLLERVLLSESGDVSAVLAVPWGDGWGAGPWWWCNTAGSRVSPCFGSGPTHLDWDTLSPALLEQLHNRRGSEWADRAHRHGCFYVKLYSQFLNGSDRCVSFCLPVTFILFLHF